MAADVAELHHDAGCGDLLAIGGDHRLVLPDRPGALQHPLNAWIAPRQSVCAMIFEAAGGRMAAMARWMPFTNAMVSASEEFGTGCFSTPECRTVRPSALAQAA